MKMDEYLNEKLTNDKTAAAVEDNYRGLMEVPGIERDPMQERTIKLNRLERLMTPAKVDIVTTTELFVDKEVKLTTYYCPNCRAKFFSSRSVLALEQREVKHCDNCGQALDWSEVEK